MWSTALTFWKNFKIPCLWIALAAALVAGGIATWLTRAVMTGQVAEAKQELAEYRASIATATSTALAEGFNRQTQAADAVRNLHDGIVKEIRNGYAAVSKSVQANTDAFRSATSEDQYRCLDLPLPDDALGVYYRPGGSATVD